MELKQSEMQGKQKKRTEITKKRENQTKRNKTEGREDAGEEAELVLCVVLYPWEAEACGFT